MVVSNAGYGLFCCVEQLTDKEIAHIIATNLTGFIQMIKTLQPYLCRRGRTNYPDVHLWPQVADAASSVYHATEFGIDSFCEALAREAAL